MKWLKRIFFGSTEKQKPLVLKNEVKPKKKSKPTKKALSKLTKAELEKMGRQHGIELDRRLTKDKLVAQLHKSL